MSLKRREDLYSEGWANWGWANASYILI